MTDISVKSASSYVQHQLAHHPEKQHFAQWLIHHCTQLTPSEQYVSAAQRLTPDQWQALRHFTEQARRGTPLAYLTGHQPFWDMDFIVSPDTLIPRQDTECAIEWLLEHHPNDARCVLDLGVGCGTLALTLAKHRPQWTVDAIDQSTACLNLTRLNAIRHQVSLRHIWAGNWFAAMPTPHRYDIIVSNPPYIPAHDPHLSQLHTEPSSALIGGADGLSDIRQIIEQAPQFLNPHGLLLIEHGFDQGPATRNLAEQAGFSAVSTLQDHNERPRLLIAHYRA